MSAEATLWAWRQPVKVREKLILLALADECNRRGIWPENLKKLSKRTGIRARTCLELIKGLTEQRYLWNMADSGQWRLRFENEEEK